MTYHIGQTVPAPDLRSVWHDAPWQPGWFLFHVLSKWELTASDYLKGHGVIDTFHPTEMIYVRNRFKRKPVPRIRPLVPGYLFAFLHRPPQWDHLFALSQGKLRGVLSRRGIPIMIREADMLGMQQLPKALAEQRAAAIEAATIHPGDMAEVIDGPMSGWTVEVAQVSGKMARLIIPLLGKEPHIDVAKLRKLKR